MSDHRYNPEKTLRAGYIQELQATIAHRDAQLAEVTRQRDELVEAVTEASKAREISTCANVGHQIGFVGDEDQRVAHHQYVQAVGKVIALARIQDQPKGEWIDIEPDGSNLPDDCTHRRWYAVTWNDDRRPIWYSDFDPVLSYLKDPCPARPLAYWSVPYTPSSAPTLPEYTEGKQ